MTKSKSKGAKTGKRSTTGKALKKKIAKAAKKTKAAA